MGSMSPSEADEAEAEPGDLVQAARNGTLEMVRSFLAEAQPGDLERKGRGGRTALHNAAQKGRGPVAELLLAARANVHATDQSLTCWTPLHLAAAKGHPDVVQMLLNAHASVDVWNAQGQTPLHEAANHGHASVVQLLLAARAFVDVTDDASPRKCGLCWTPLHFAAAEGHPEVTEILLQAKASINAEERLQGDTPLHLAANDRHAGMGKEGSVEGHHRVVQLLLAAGASADVPNRRGRTPCDIAQKNGKTKVLGALQPVHVTLLSGRCAMCDPSPDRHLKDLKEEAEQQLGVKIGQLLTSSGEKPPDFMTLAQAKISYGDLLHAVVAREEEEDAASMPVCDDSDVEASLASSESDSLGTKPPTQTPHGAYNLQDPRQLVELLINAKIGLIRLDYLRELRHRGGQFPRRQEADLERTTAGQPALVQIEELRSLEFDELGNATTFIMKPSPRRVTVVFESISHAWESMEHPDPWGFQLHSITQIERSTSSNQVVWLFYDYTSLYQYGERTELQEHLFRQALDHMHTLYAHEAVKVHILDELTPATWKHQGSIQAYSERGRAVLAMSIDQLKLNTTPYMLRGWCQAEMQWASLRISLERSFPLPPELFRKRVDELGLQFTHQDDKELVMKLQQKVFEEKVLSTRQLEVAGNLNEEALEVLCAALPFYKELDEIVVNGNRLSGSAAVAVVRTQAKFLQMESCGLKDEDVERLVLEWKSSRAEKIYTWRTTTLATRVFKL